MNARIVGATGEPHVLQSPGLLEGACARPQNHCCYNGTHDVVELGCTLLFALARNHPFLQGNKRTAFVAMIGFFGVNGYQFDIRDSMANAEYIISAIQGAITEAEFCEAIRPGVARV